MSRRPQVAGPRPGRNWSAALSRASRKLLLLVVFAVGLARTADSGPPAPDQAPISAATDDKAASPAPQLFRGRVVFLKDALAKRDIETAEETAEHVVLESESGELIPILADWRGRAFYQDQLLRDRKVELIGFRHHGVPYLNVIAVYTFDENDRRMYTDYWCEICSIPMYEIQACECCQGPIELRFQPRDLPDYIQDPPATDASPADPSVTK